MDNTEPLEFNGDTPRILRHQERASGKRRGSGIERGQDLTNHEKGPMSPKPSSLPEELDSRILRGYCGAKEFDDSSPLYTRLKARAEEGKMSEDVQRKPKWPRDVTEDNPVLSIPNPRDRKSVV